MQRVERCNKSMQVVGSWTSRLPSSISRLQMLVVCSCGDQLCMQVGYPMHIMVLWFIRWMPSPCGTGDQPWMQQVEICDKTLQISDCDSVDFLVVLQGYRCPNPVILVIGNECCGLEYVTNPWRLWCWGCPIVFQELQVLCSYSSRNQLWIQWVEVYTKTMQVVVLWSSRLSCSISRL